MQINYLPSTRGNRDKGKVTTVAMNCHQYFFGGKYDLIQLQRQIIHQNDGISMRNSLKPSPPPFSIYINKTMKMTYRRVASSNERYLFKNKGFTKRSQYIRIKNPLHRQSEKTC